MNKKEVKEEVASLKRKIIKVMKSEKNIAYKGNDDDFSDSICHLYGSLKQVLEDMDTVLQEK